MNHDGSPGRCAVTCAGWYRRGGERGRGRAAEREPGEVEAVDLSALRWAQARETQQGREQIDPLHPFGAPARPIDPGVEYEERDPQDLFVQRRVLRRGGVADVAALQELVSVIRGQDDGRVLGQAEPVERVENGAQPGVHSQDPGRVESADRVRVRRRVQRKSCSRHHELATDRVAQSGRDGGFVDAQRAPVRGVRPVGQVDELVVVPGEKGLFAPRRRVRQALEEDRILRGRRIGRRRA